MTLRVAARTPSYNYPRKLTNTVSRDVNEQRKNATVDEACPRSWLCTQSVISPLSPNDNLRGSLCGELHSCILFHRANMLQERNRKGNTKAYCYFFS